MKRGLIAILLALSLSGCGAAPNQSARNTPGNNTNGSNGQNASAASKTNEQTVSWEAQGMTFTLPADWRKDDQFSKDDEKRGGFFTKSYLAWESPAGQKIQFSVETGERDFPVSKEAMLEMDYRNEKEGNEGTDTEVSYREVDGIKGMMSRRLLEDQRVMLQWFAYRHYKGKAQSFMVLLSGKQNEVEKILNSLKVSRD